VGKLYVVATPIGNLSDISERALTTLKSVNLIAAEDTRRTLQLLNHFDIKTPVVSYHKHNEQDRSSELIARMQNENIDIAQVSDAGTPCISDPGCILVSKAREQGIEVVAIPGASAITAALSVCGFVFNQFCFLGFIPRTKKEKEDFYNILSSSDIQTHVLYESPNRIIDSLKDISQVLPGCEVFVINDISKYYEKSYKGTISDVVSQLETEQNAGLGEYTIVIHKDMTGDVPSAEEEHISIEALLIDEMVMSGCSLKEAISAVSSRNSGLGKNEVYKASLRLKELL
jgi:16S rRNA (cytidine1402-2'-O)-methyltransferase